MRIILLLVALLNSESLFGIIHSSIQFAPQCLLSSPVEYFGKIVCIENYDLVFEKDDLFTSLSYSKIPRWKFTDEGQISIKDEIQTTSAAVGLKDQILSELSTYTSVGFFIGKHRIIEENRNFSSKKIGKFVAGLEFSIKLFVGNLGRFTPTVGLRHNVKLIKSEINRLPQYTSVAVGIDYSF